MEENSTKVKKTCKKKKKRSDRSPKSKGCKEPKPGVKHHRKAKRVKTIEEEIDEEFFKTNEVKERAA